MKWFNKKPKPYQLIDQNLPFKVVYKPHEYILLQEGKIVCGCYCHENHGVIAQPLIDNNWSCRCNICPCKFLR